MMEKKPTHDIRWLIRIASIKRNSMYVIGFITPLIYGLNVAFPIVTQRIIDIAVSRGGNYELFIFCMLGISVIGIELALSSVRERYVTQVGIFLDSRISRKFFIHLLKLTSTELSRLNTGNLVNTFFQIRGARDLILQLLPTIIFELGSALVALIMIFYFKWTAGLLVIILCSLMITASSRKQKIFYAAAEESFAAENRRTEVLQETVSGAATLKILAAEGNRLAAWFTATNSAVGAIAKLRLTYYNYNIIVQSTSRLLSFAIVLLGAYYLYSGSASIGELVALQLLVGRVTGPLLQSGNALQQINQLQVAMSEFNSFMRTETEHEFNNKRKKDFVDKTINLANVSAKYGNQNKRALIDINLDLPSRGFVAIVGRNGSGKTTLLKILSRTISHSSGEVKLFGHYIEDYDSRWLRRNMAIVDQNTALFTGTVRSNLNIGRAEIGDENIWRALDHVEISEHIKMLEGQLDASIGKEGKALSGGQRQRLAIARALVRPSSFILLDEPTTSMDSEVAVQIERRFQELAKENLIILVSHHLSATRHADRIIVLDAGRIVGDGRHSELLETCFTYKKLWNDYVRDLGHIDEMRSSAPA